jgi:hypothetical protein
MIDLEVERLTEEQLVDRHEFLKNQKFFKGLTEQEQKEFEAIKEELWTKYRL